MSDEPRNPRYVKAHHVVTVEAAFDEPALAGAAFDLIRLLAEAKGLGDIGSTRVELTLEFSGVTIQKKVDEFSHRLDRLWFPSMVSDEVSRAETYGDKPSEVKK